MAQFNITVKTRPLYCGPERREFGELVFALFKCHFEDTDAFDITLYSDTERYNTSIDLTDATETEIVNNQDAAGQPQFRHSVQVVPPAGFFGTHFQAQTVKKLPTTGAFEYDGVDMHFIRRPQLTPEFVHGGGSLDDGWD